ncbi:MAG: SPOR domain-containing protein [Pseudomonadota bacterium]
MLAGLYAGGFAGALAAQGNVDTTSREIVQPLPSEDVSRLNSALMQLARRPESVSALIEAGNAALQLGDFDAAMGFFGRAESNAPDNAQVKMGMAAVFLRSGRPIEALSLFSEAERAGASPRDVMADRGLAYDLVGNNAEAQAAYRAALAVRRDDQTVRRLALSHAIAGNRAEFEATLKPLLDERDFAAYRTQAFALAVLGEQREAAAIADAVMPRDLAARVIPYLDFMPRLTKAQQAAAANLGIFPRAAQVGRDDPRIAQYAAEGSAIASAADARLEPSGEPLGATEESVAAASGTELASANPGVAGISEIPPAARLPASQPSSSPDSASNGQSVPVDEVEELVQIARSTEDATSQSNSPGFDLTRSQGSVAVDRRGNNDASMAARTSSATAQPEPATASSVADAFADFDLGDTTGVAVTRGEGAVDLAAIEIPREVDVAVVSEPAAPEHPQRIWVQVATGRDRSALRFDWRRLNRQADGLLGDYEPHVVGWGQSNRLLAGPLASNSEARDLVNALSDEGIDTFTYSSPEGTEIQLLK